MLNRTCKKCYQTFTYQPPKRGRHPEYCSDTCRRRRYYTYTPVIREYKLCDYCGETFYAAYRDQECCSDTCRHRRRYYRDLCVRVDMMRQCDNCSDIYHSTHGNSMYCSAKCRNRAFHVRRRNKPEYVKARARYGAARNAAKRGASDVVPFDSVEVYKRDNWTCYLCGYKINPDVKVPIYTAPTVDHIVPLIKNGAHALDNVKAAHFICNSSRSDREDVTHIDPHPDILEYACSV